MKNSNSILSQKEAQPIYHTVTLKDTLWALTRKYGTTVNNIIALNNIKNINLIYVGQKLRMK